MLICLVGGKQFTAKWVHKNFLFCNFEKLHTFSFVVPFKITHKNLRLIEQILLNEARKLFPQHKEVPFGFHLSENESNKLRCYVIDPEEYDQFSDILLANKVFPGRVYPFFAALYAFATRYEGRNKIIVFVDDFVWYVYAFQGKEMVFQRFIRFGKEGGVQGLFSQMEIVIAHLVQHLRYKPEAVVFLGEKVPEQIILGVPSVVERVSLEELFKEVLKQKAIWDYAIRLPRLERDWKWTKIFKRASIGCLGLFVFFSSYGYFNFKKLREDMSELEGVRASVQRLWEGVREDMALLQEDGMRDWLELLKLRSSVPDTRRMLSQVSFLAETEGVRLEKVILKPQQRALFLEGEIPLLDFSGRQRAFSLLLERVKGKGLRVNAVNWDLIKGNFKLELALEP